MTCCNQKCEQGKNCPNRIQYEPSPIGWKDWLAAIVIGGGLGFLLTQGWLLR